MSDGHAAEQARFIGVQREALKDPRWHLHGSYTGYAYGCRCPPCKSARDARKQDWRNNEGLDEKTHGTAKSYNWGCRCEPCREAKLDDNAKSLRPAYDPAAASLQDLRLFAQGLGFPVPRNGPRLEALVKRYNRQHPERPYVL